MQENENPASPGPIAMENKKISFSLPINQAQAFIPHFRGQFHADKLTNWIFSLIGERKFKRAIKDLKRLMGNESIEQAHVYWLLGRVSMAQENYSDAEQFFMSAIALDPNHYNSLVSYGEMLANMKKPKDAIDFFMEAAKVKPTESDIPRLIAECCMQGGLLIEAEAYYLKALNLNQENWLAWYGLANSFHAVGRVSDAVEVCQKYLSFVRKLKVKGVFEAAAHASALFILMGSEQRYHRLMDAFKEWASIYSNESFLFPGIDQNRDRKIKIGYVGGDFYAHAATKIYRPLFQHANHNKFEIYAYSNAAISDHITEMMIPWFDRYINVKNFSDEQLYKRILADGIDILVDLNGHSQNNRLKVFSMKAAPLQVTGLGFISPTNIPQMDFFFTDGIITDESREKYSFEAPLRLDCVMHWEPDDNFHLELPEAPEKDEEGNIKRGIVFGCANNLYKISPQVITCWSSIMKQVKGSRLLLKAKQLGSDLVAQRIMKQFESCGIDPERIELIGQTSFEKHIQIMGRVDVALDPFPYQGGITTCEALYMGCPVLSTMIGTRTSATIISQAERGVFGYVADDPREYIELGVKMAKDWKKGKYDRQAIRDAFMASRVADGKAYCKQIEATYIQLFNLIQDAVESAQAELAAQAK